jgi:alpha-galactosidase
VRNDGVVPNLPNEAIVEVPGYVDKNGMSIPQLQDLPRGCAAVCNQSIAVQGLATQAAVNGDIELLRQAFMMDPLVGAVCNPPEIWQLVDEMLVGQAQWLPQYKREIARAKKRLAGAKRLGTKSSKGAARLKTKSVAEMQKNAAAARKMADAADKGNLLRQKARKKA